MTTRVEAGRAAESLGSKLRRRGLTGRLPAIFLSLAVVAVRASTTSRADEPTASSTAADTTDDAVLHTFATPLDGGSIRVADLLAPLAEELGLDAAALRQHADVELDVTGATGMGALRLIEALSGGILTLETRDSELIITIDRLNLRRQRGKFHDSVRRMFELWFPEAAATALTHHGTFVYDAAGRLAPLSTDATLPETMVVLIHGLDDPGLIWRSLAPALRREGYAACEIRYPNDQPIAKSTDFAAARFEELHARGVRRVAIVAHSMGSLVSRDLLTRSTYYDGAATAGVPGRFPGVSRFVMIGPPNHGSPMACLRFGAELRDQITRALSGDGLLIGGFFDGAGEAQDDLTPDSPFLTDLNARPLPVGLPVTVVAGSASPIGAESVQALGASFGDVLAGVFDTDATQAVERFQESFDSLITGMGDGCVPLESTKLEGVTDHVVVPGNHLSMIRTITASSDRVPAAVPIVLDRLGLDRTAGGH